MVVVSTSRRQQAVDRDPDQQAVRCDGGGFLPEMVETG
jgi:hypothetical protein